MTKKSKSIIKPLAAESELRERCVRMALDKIFEDERDYSAAFDRPHSIKVGQSVEAVLKRADAIFKWIKSPT